MHRTPCRWRTVGENAYNWITKKSMSWKSRKIFFLKVIKTVLVQFCPLCGDAQPHAVACMQEADLFLICVHRTVWFFAFWLLFVRIFSDCDTKLDSKEREYASMTLKSLASHFNLERAKKYGSCHQPLPSKFKIKSNSNNSSHMVCRYEIFIF